MASQHTYITDTYSDVKLHVLKTHASNVKLVSHLAETDSLTTLQDAGYFGVNSCFFAVGSDNHIMNIAMYNGKNIGPFAQGTQNTMAAGGAIGWNGSQLSTYASVTNASEISFAAKTGTWVQGGVALWLGYNQWESKVRSQNASSYLQGEAYRTALVADMVTQSVHMIVTVQKRTLSKFRAAIQTYLGIYDGAQANKTYQAIMLDGGQSTQFRAKNQSNSIIAVPSGSERPVPAFVILKNTN